MKRDGGPPQPHPPLTTPAKSNKTGGGSVKASRVWVEQLGPERAIARANKASFAGNFRLSFPASIVPQLSPDGDRVAYDFLSD